MGAEKRINDEEAEPLTGRNTEYLGSRASIESSSTSSISLTLVDRVSQFSQSKTNKTKDDNYDSRNFEDDRKYHDEEQDVEGSNYTQSGGRPAQKQVQIIFWFIVMLFIGGWAISFVSFLTSHNDDGRKHTEAASASDKPVENHISGKKISLKDVFSSEWNAVSHDMVWIDGPDGEDGLLLQNNGMGKGDYLSVEDVRRRQGKDKGQDPIILMKGSSFSVDQRLISPSKVWPSPDLKTVLVMSGKETNWRHSFTGYYWLFDVESQSGQPLDPEAPDERIQLASWSPNSDAVVFTRNNNMYIRNISSNSVKDITTDGGVDLFYGVPDWVYEEEVYGGNSATWWSNDGKYVAFLRTNESMVPEFPVEYFISRPSGDGSPEETPSYPDVKHIKYPKAGAPNPVVNLQFYDVAKEETFSIDISDDFPDDDRLIIEVIFASEGKLLVRETNRESNVVNMVLIDLLVRRGRIVRSEDMAATDGGWVEPSQSTKIIPADPTAGRQHDGYIDMFINRGYQHMAYFTPLENPQPFFLTSGNWEVVQAPSAVDIKQGLVYFVGTREDPIERHVYGVKLDGSDLKPITNISDTAYYDVSFSRGAGYMLLKYQGPEVPWEKLISTPANENKFEDIIETNDHLSELTKKFALPSLHYGTVPVDGHLLPTLERRPPNFDPKKRYPVLFQQYSGPGSQTVTKKFTIDFQTYVAANLGYVVVTVDGRGTGFNGRDFRCIVRGNLGYYEAHDQITAAQNWGKKSYVDESRIAIWGWSYGGFMALKTLEQDAGETFQYGIAVAPVTDWRLYDSIYTERYMGTPQQNPEGYDNTSISDTEALSKSVRFLLMHGSADDNVHFQNSLTFLDKLNVAGVNNYDVHVFPDSDHNIFFHNAYLMLHQRLSDWLVNAFNGEWVNLSNPVPNSLFRRMVTPLLGFGGR